MSLLKLIDRIGQDAISGSKMVISKNNWAKIKAAYEKSMMYKSGTRTFSPMAIHARNGSRGEGIGMGHRNRQNKNK
jgi:hypothetical protein